MDRNREIAVMMTRFGSFLEEVTTPPIDMSTMATGGVPTPEMANKLNALIAEQEGTLPRKLKLALENWVDAWFSAVVMAQNAEENPEAAVRQAASHAYSYLMGQLLALQEVFDNWGEDGPTIVTLE